MRVPEWLQRTWAWISNALNIQQLLAIVGLWNITILAGGALVGLLIAVVGRFPFWGWLLAIAVSAALGLFISNEMTSRRLLHRHGRPVRLTRESPELIQFVNAWLMPAWDKALDILVRIRGQVRQTEGERIEALLQLGIIDPVVSSRRLLRERLAGQGNSPLEELVADGYRHYELVVKWLWHGGTTINLAAIVDSQDFRDWQAADDKLLDHLRALIAHPTLELPNLSTAFREIEEGGVAKLVRLNLNRITVLSVLPEEHGTYARLQVSNKGRETIRRLRADGRIIFGAPSKEESDYPIRWRGRKEPEIDLVSGRPPEILDVAEVVGFREFKFHTAEMAVGNGQTSEHFSRSQTEDEGLGVRVIFTAESNLEPQEPRYYQIRMNEDDPGFCWTRLDATDDQIRRDEQMASPSLFFRELTKDEVLKLAQR